MPVDAHTGTVCESVWLVSVAEARKSDRITSRSGNREPQGCVISKGWVLVCAGMTEIPMIGETASFFIHVVRHGAVWVTSNRMAGLQPADAAFRMSHVLPRPVTASPRGCSLPDRARAVHRGYRHPRPDLDAGRAVAARARNDSSVSTPPQRVRFPACWASSPPPTSPTSVRCRAPSRWQAWRR